MSTVPPVASVSDLDDPTGIAVWPRIYLGSAWRAWRGPKLPDVERFCFFIGYARSGHSLVGSLLNAHPSVVISHELDCIRYVRMGFRRSQIYSLILQRDDVFESIGRVWTDYNYSVPGAHQGDNGAVLVIGDKRGRKSALELNERPELLDRLRNRVRVPIRVIHVTRNPFDNIVSEAHRFDLTLEAATRWYEKSCMAVAATRPRLFPEELLDIPYESFESDPRSALTQLCSFIGVEASPDYLEACAAVVRPNTKRRRDSMEWTTTDVERVEALIDRYDFLGQYTFDG